MESGNSQKKGYVVEVTLQQQDYKGSFKFLVVGTQPGLDVLNYFFDTYPDVEDLYQNDCNLSYSFDGTNDWVTYELKNSSGDVLHIKQKLVDFEKNVGKLEIIEDFEIKNGC